MSDTEFEVPILFVETWNIPAISVRLCTEPEAEVFAVLDFSRARSWVRYGFYMQPSFLEYRRNARPFVSADASAQEGPATDYFVGLDVIVGKLIASDVHFNAKVVMDRTYDSIACGLGADFAEKFKRITLDWERGVLRMVPWDDDHLIADPFDIGP